jgi:hypothetical protein
MDLRLAALKAISFYLLHNVLTLNQFRKFLCVTVVCKHFASYQDYPNYKWDITLCRSYLNPYCLGRKTAFFSGHLNLHAKPDTRIPYREKNYNN